MLILEEEVVGPVSPGLVGKEEGVIAGEVDGVWWLVAKDSAVES